MFVRFLLLAVGLISGGAYYAAQNVPAAQAFVATVVAIVRQDPDMLFRNETPEAALRELRQEGRHVVTAPERAASPSSDTPADDPAPAAAQPVAPRDFTMRSKSGGSGHGFGLKGPKPPRIDR